MSLGSWIEKTAWFGGGALLLLYGGGSLWIEASRLHGLEVLRQAQAATADIRDPSSEQIFAETTIEGSPQSDGSVRVPPAERSLWSYARKRAYAESFDRPGVPQGALSIPSLDLEVPIYAGTSELNLNRGAAWIEGTAPLLSGGNVGIAAHRDGFFRALKDVSMDAEIIVAGTNGSMRYRVVELSIVQPTDVQVLAPTEMPSLTLVTCYPFYFVGNAPERYIVRAELIDSGGGSGMRDREFDVSSDFGLTPTSH